MMYFIVRVFQQREDYYRAQMALKIKYLQYGNDWLLLIQSIEALPEGIERREELRQLSHALLDRIKREDPVPKALEAPRPTRAPQAEPSVPGY